MVASSTPVTAPARPSTYPVTLVLKTDVDTAIGTTVDANIDWTNPREFFQSMWFCRQKLYIRLN